MKRISVLPADTYTVVNKSIITEKDKRIISLLYQPIIGHAATALYYTLIDDLDKSELISDDLTHHHIMTNMQLSLENLIIAREKLEAVGLLKTYMKQDNINHFVYLIYSPLSAIDFFNHPILNVVLYNNLGKVEYEKMVSIFKMPRINLKDYTDVTCSFDEVFSSVSGTVLEYDDCIMKSESSNILVNKSLDFDLIISGFPESQINSRCFTDEVKQLINKLAFLYDLNTLDMQSIIRGCINEKGLIDKTLLRKSCRDYYKFDNAGKLPTLIYNRQPEFLKKPVGDSSKRAKMIYTFENITPYQLLKAKYKGGEPTDRDKKLIESLLVDLKLNPGVVNVLISYVLKVNNEQLTKSYVETIAGQWKRLNIETVEDAMNVTQKEYSKLKKKAEKTKSTTVKEKTSSVSTKEPDWFNKNVDINETTEEEVEELDMILKGLV
ncbi:MAG: DnaD domain protein [Bacilli bacterium]|nr:DnaD domain protein [Bacilli bacterium]